MRSIARAVVVASLVLVAAAGTSAEAGAKAPIRPGQHFIGLVNGRHVQPVVLTVCGGPGSPGRTGPVLPGQQVAVRRSASGTGYTGLFSDVHVWIDQDVSAGGPQQVTLSDYGSGQDIPASVRVPCDGLGQVEFSSCPRLAPCAFGWVPDVVDVRFVNIAA